MNPTLLATSEVADKTNFEQMFYICVGVALLLYCIGIIVGSRATKDSQDE